MIYRFDRFSFDAARYELTRDGEPVAAEPQVLEVLETLLANRDRVVSKEELVETVWRGRHVADSAISRAIKEVRRLLGDSAAESRYVTTVYGRGFRFSAGVVADEGTSSSRGTGDGDESRRRQVPPRHPLPEPLTPLVGREREIERICRLLAKNRLLTITGPGGTGKTRLAIATAKRAREGYPGGVVFVPLVDVRDREGLVGAIRRAAGLRDSSGPSTIDAVGEQLRGQELLLVLDNFEQLVEYAGDVTLLLERCPELTALVTSRFVLKVPGEQEVALAPLAVPGVDASSDTLRESDAVAMFLARARAALPDFEPDDEELAYVAEICRRLDGLPLALELAAARVKMFSVRLLWERLAKRLDLLSSGRARGAGRHATLEEAHAWSHDLLDLGERVLFRRLAVFSGGFSLETVGPVAGLDPDVALEALGSLVDKSLVERARPAAGEPRFRLLETTRAFALTRLRETDEEAVVRDRHAAWFETLAREGGRALAGGDQATWLERLDADYPNLRAALEWSREGGDAAIGLRTAASLGRYWSARGIYREGRGELQSLLGSSGASTADPEARAEALLALGLLAHLLCDYDRALSHLRRALEILEETGGPAARADVLNHLTWVALQTRPLPEASNLAGEALRRNEEAGGDRGIAVAWNNLGHIAMFRGDLPAAEESFRASLERRRAAGDSRGEAFALSNLALARLRLDGSLNPIEGWLDTARDLVTKLDDRPLMIWIECMRAGLLRRAGDPAAAIEILERCELEGRSIHHPDGDAWIHLLTAEARAASGDFDPARREATRARETWRSLGVPWCTAAAGLLLGRIASEEGRPEEARELYREVSDLARSHGFDGLAREAARGLDGPGS